jgi:ATP-dependent DNA helicase RecG
MPVKSDILHSSTSGGTIYIGVNSDGDVVGVENPDFVMQQVSDSLRDGIRPDISLFTCIELLHDNNKTYIKLQVDQGTRKPYYLSDKGLKSSGVYTRCATTSAPASEDAIRTMIKTTDGDSFESNRPLVQELTFDTLIKEMNIRNLEFSEVQMRNLGILTPEDIYTNLGLLV